MGTQNLGSTTDAVSGTGSRTSLPVWSFVMGLVSVLFAWTIVPPVAAVITGVLGLKRISAGHVGSKWMAWTGLVLGIVFALTIPLTSGFFG